MICGLPPALSVSDSVPVRAPEAVGVKVTLMVQVPPAAKVAGLVGQALAPVLVAAKSPEGANELIVKAAAPVFVSVTVIGALVVASSWLPKSRLVGANPTPGAVPFPLSVMICGLPPALSVSDSVPDRKSTRLNSSHGYISYAVFCLKKKKDKPQQSVEV